MSRPLYEARIQSPLAGFEPTLLEVPYGSSRLSWRLGHRTLWILIKNKSNLITVKSNTDRKRKNNQQQSWRLKAAATLISSHKSKIKIIAPSKNTFQNTDALQIVFCPF